MDLPRSILLTVSVGTLFQRLNLDPVKLLGARVYRWMKRLRSRMMQQTTLTSRFPVSLPDELEGFSARFDMALPTEDEREAIIKRVAAEWSLENPGSRVQADCANSRNCSGLCRSILCCRDLKIL